jgi:hypothetical protein
VLLPGEWMGWVVGPASLDRGYMVEVTPLEASVDGAYIARAVVQQEFFMGEWTDVLRVLMPEGFPSVRANLRVYATARMPVIARFEAELQPGEWISLPLRASAAKGAHIVEVNPLHIPEGGEFAEQVVVRPEFTGNHWQDVLRLLAPADQSSLRVQVRVYQWVQ